MTTDPKTVYEDERIDEVNERLTLIQKKSGLTFGTDAYLLAAFLRPSRRARAVEFGAGTGIISLLAVTKEKVDHVVAVELQPEYAALTERNVRLNGLGDKIDVLSADVRTLTPASLGYECDVVFSNPPYMRTDTGLPNSDGGKNSARHETAGTIRDFAEAAARILKHGGTFYCVYRPDRLTDLIEALRKSSLEPKRMTFVAADTETAPSMVLVECKKGGGAGLTVTPTLFLYQDTPKSGARKMTEAASAVYDTCALYPIRTRKKAKSARQKSDESNEVHHE